MAAVDEILKVRRAIEKHWKDAEIFWDPRAAKPIETHATKSAIINMITGIGGLPRGRVTEIYGPESSGKTTVALESAAALQRTDPAAVVLYIDFEHAVDPTYAAKLDVDLNVDRFILCQPNHFEQGDTIIDAYLTQSLVDMVIIDSAAAMVPQAEMEGEVDQATRIGLQAQLMSRFLTRTTKKISRGRRPTLIFLNQTRMKIDIKNPRNNMEDSASGKALKFYCSLRIALEVTRKEGDESQRRPGQPGTDTLYNRNQVRATTVKNKLSPQYQRGQFYIEYGKGTNNLLSIAELAEARLGIMSGAGFFKYQGDTTETSFQCRGREAFHELLEKSPKLLKELEGKIAAAMREEQAKALGVRNVKTQEPTDDDTKGVIILKTEDYSAHQTNGQPNPAQPGDDGMPVEDTP